MDYLFFHQRNAHLSGNANWNGVVDVADRVI